MPDTLRARGKPLAAPLSVNVSATRRELLREEVKHGWTRPTRSSPRAVTPSEESDQEEEPALMQLKLLKRLAHHTPSYETASVNSTSHKISPTRVSNQYAEKQYNKHQPIEKSASRTKQDRGTQTRDDLPEPKPTTHKRIETLIVCITKVFLMLLWIATFLMLGPEEWCDERCSRRTK
ncbi:hypothetical protein FALBO_201 [Fusarium albosuccineum]|uniref:Uncharacterized protein n=1 Tax=Fusarium albosuccineum TaxID=1237068 RepID=A0A8H4LR83_9HYPO|nr:hypothetical protein FALBO_201 [Fusarium albosuccineum]